MQPHVMPCSPARAHNRNVMNKMKSFFVVQGGDDEWDGHRRHRSNSTRRGSHLQRTERRRGTLGTNRSLHQVCVCPN